MYMSQEKAFEELKRDPSFWFGALEHMGVWNESDLYYGVEKVRIYAEAFGLASDRKIIEARTVQEIVKCLHNQIRVIEMGGKKRVIDAEIRADYGDYDGRLCGAALRIHGGVTSEEIPWYLETSKQRSPRDLIFA